LTYSLELVVAARHFGMLITQQFQNVAKLLWPSFNLKTSEVLPRLRSDFNFLD